MDKITITDLKNKKYSGSKITMLTAYDYPQAKLMDEAGMDCVLVGDSLGMVALGYDSTVSVTMEEMLHHARAVRRAVKRAYLIADMPFGSYEKSADLAVSNAARFREEAGCDAVKLEGGIEAADIVKHIVKAGIDVLGHIGLMPQTAANSGGFKVRGKDAEAAARLLHDARTLQDSGAFGLVLECVPDRVARVITEKLKIVTISCGAGPYCDGQVLVTNDLLGFYDRFTPKFVKKYINLTDTVQDAFKRYKADVESGVFPSGEHSFHVKDDEFERFKKMAEDTRL